MRAARRGAIVALLLMAGCGGVQAPAPAAPVPATTPAATEAVAVAPAPPAAPPSPPAPVAPVQSDTAPAAPAAPDAAAAPAAPAPVAKPAAPATTAPPKAPTPAAQAPKAPAAAPEAAAPKPAPLDLKSLEQRLRSTNAIGVMTKLTLKNQVDDLLDKFRAYYQGKLKVELAELRRSYDLLVQKVLSLLQDADPPLAKDIVASREALWGILADPKKFATI